MPTGAYLLSGHDGPYAVERFRCDGSGDDWRYEATREHLSTGATLGRIELQLTGSTTRLHAEGGGWVLRGAAGAGEVLWRRGEQESTAAGDGFTGSSPAFLVAGSRRGPDRLRLIEVTEPVLATRSVLQQWAAQDESERDGVRVRRYEVDDLATGERRVVHLAGDVVVDAPGVRLVELDLG